MLKYLVLVLLFSSCANFVEKTNAITSKIGKKKGTCSPLDKAQSKKGCVDERVEAKKAALDSKVKKRKGYCSPLDKAQKKVHCI